jgi:hypothetical protein
LADRRGIHPCLCNFSFSALGGVAHLLVPASCRIRQGGLGIRSTARRPAIQILPPRRVPTERSLGSCHRVRPSEREGSAYRPSSGGRYWSRRRQRGLVGLAAGGVVNVWSIEGLSQNDRPLELAVGCEFGPFDRGSGSSEVKVRSLVDADLGNRLKMSFTPGPGGRPSPAASPDYQHADRKCCGDSHGFLPCRHIRRNSDCRASLDSQTVKGPPRALAEGIPLCSPVRAVGLLTARRLTQPRGARWQSTRAARSGVWNPEVQLHSRGPQSHFLSPSGTAQRLGASRMA